MFSSHDDLDPRGRFETAGHATEQRDARPGADVAGLARAEPSADVAAAEPAPKLTAEERLVDAAVRLAGG